MAKRQKDTIKDEQVEPMWQDIDHAPLPAEPTDASLLFLNHSHVVMKYSTNQELAEDFLRRLLVREYYGRGFQTRETCSVSAAKTWSTIG